MSEWAYKSLDELIQAGQVELGRGNIISKLDIEACPGPYPIYSSSARGDGKFGEYGKFMFDEELISWSVDGGGNFFYRPKHQFSVTNVSGYLRIRTKELSYRFLYYALDLQHRDISFDYTTKAHPSVIRKLYSIPAIPKPEQDHIAEILSTVDETIEQTEALIAKYQQIKAGLMHDLFTRGVTPDGRLRPTYEQAPHFYKESPLGWIPKEWEVRRLGVILKEFGGYLQTGPFGSQLHAHEYEHEGVPVVMPQDINDGIISIDQIARIVERKAEELSRHRMRVGDIVIARRGELSRAAAIDDSHEGWLCGTGCFLLRLGRNALHPDFAACIYRHDLIQRQIAGVAVGTTMPSLNNTVMERLFFPLCDPEEQVRITERLDNLDQLLQLTQSRVAKLRHQKQGLMSDLLTGRVRVKVAEPGGGTV